MYFLTTYRVLRDIIDDRRTVGMSSSYENLHRAVMNNSCDIFECGYYQYACITFVEEGLYPRNIEQQWFEYDEFGTVITIAQPEELEDYIIG